VKLKVKIGLRGGDDKPFMGIGLAWLLRGVERRGSLSAAARALEMSYSKAHKLVRTLEAALGRPVLASARGGAARGGAALTPEGARFLARYEAFDAAVRKSAEKHFVKFRRGL
jgi:molybdate transport system regulatory protein